MSQDISAFHAALAVRSGRHKLFSYGVRGRLRTSQVPDVTVEEGNLQIQPPEPDSTEASYDVYERASGVKDGYGRPLYMPQQIQAQLEESQVCPIDHNNRSFGETRGICTSEEEALGCSIHILKSLQLFDHEQQRLLGDGREMGRCG
jgi:hypothetical protein